MVWGCSIPQLTRVVKSPAVDRAVVKNSAGVVNACRNSGCSGDSRDGNGGEAAGCCSVSQLARGVPSPAVDHAVIKKGASVEVACRNGDCGGDPRDDNRGSAAGSGYCSIPQLAKEVISPTVDRAVVKKGAGVGAASGNGGCCGNS